MLFFSSLGYAQNQSFCRAKSDGKKIQQFLAHPSNQLPFKNQGGIGNGGVCWWYSRFIRNTAYLAHFRPELPRPNLAEAYRIIEAIRRGQVVVTVPGYFNLQEFSNDYGQLILETLERWQLSDGLIRQNWVIGLAGSFEVHPDRLRFLMDSLYSEVNDNKDVVYQKLQFQGIDAHAWLVVGMKQLHDGYRLEVLDSNFPGQVHYYVYRHGMTHFVYREGNTKFVPYIGQAKELGRIKNVLASSCRAVSER